MLLNSKSKLSERQRGCVFVEDLSSLNDVIRNGGTPTGNCVIGKKFVGNGANFILYNNARTKSTATNFSLIVKDIVAPTDVTTDSAIYSQFITGTIGCIFEFYQGGLYFWINGGSYAGYIPAASNQVIGDVAVVYDGAGADNAARLKIYVKGVLQSPTYVSTIPASFSNPNQISIGSWCDGSKKLLAGGSFGDVQVFNASLSAQEVLDYSNNSTFVKKKTALVNLPMNMATYDPANFTTGSVIGDETMELPNVTYWVVISDASYTKITTNPHSGTQCMRLKMVTAANPAVYAKNLVSEAVFVVGSKYRIRGYMRSDGVAYPYMYAGSGAPSWVGSLSTDWQPFDVTFTAANVYLSFVAITSLADSYCDIDDLIVEKVYESVLDTSGNGTNLNGVSNVVLTKLPTIGIQKAISTANYDIITVPAGKLSNGTDDYPFTLIFVSLLPLNYNNSIIQPNGVYNDRGIFIGSGATSMYFRLHSSNNQIIGQYLNIPYSNNELCCFAMTYSGSKVNTGIKAYKNGELLASSAEAANSYTNLGAGSLDLALFKDPTWVTPQSITFKGLKLLPFEATATQIKDLTNDMLNSLNLI